MIRLRVVDSVMQPESSKSEARVHITQHHLSLSFLRHLLPYLGDRNTHIAVDYLTRWRLSSGGHRKIWSAPPASSSRPLHYPRLSQSDLHPFLARSTPMREVDSTLLSHPSLPKMAASRRREPSIFTTSRRPCLPALLRPARNQMRVKTRCARATASSQRKRRKRWRMCSAW